MRNMDDFQDGTPPSTVEQPAQDRWANMSPEDRFLMEQFERDDTFRQNARALYHQVSANQYASRQGGQPQQQSPVDAKRGELEKLQARKLEIERIPYQQRRDVTHEEGEEWQRIDKQEAQLERELLRLEADETRRLRQEVQQQAQVGQFQQQVGQRFAQFAQPRIQQMNVPAAKKTELYNKMWGIFTTHPFYPQIVDIQAADELMKFAYNDLVVNHGAPKQRAQDTGRSDERYNDIETTQEDGPKDRFSHMPPELAARMRAKYGERPLN